MFSSTEKLNKCQREIYIKLRKKFVAKMIKSCAKTQISRMHFPKCISVVLNVKNSVMYVYILMDVYFCVNKFTISINLYCFIIYQLEPNLYIYIRWSKIVGENLPIAGDIHVPHLIPKIFSMS